VKDAIGNVQRILVLGGTSEIALATVQRLTEGRADADVTLAARPGTRRADAASALRGRGLTVTELDLDVTDRDSFERAIGATFDVGRDVDVVLIAFGVLGDQERAWQDLDAALEMTQVNYTAAVGCGVLVAARMRAQGHGAIVAFSSVAGELPRRSNFVYGSTKAGMDAFFSGLGEAVARDGVEVIVVRPGFVRTRMTAGLRAAPLSQTADQVAAVVVDGLRAGRDRVWAPSTMRWVMSALRHLPRVVLRRLPI
jgi:decaprenylphospho-beta-D-erythro-pentofuranosid-2-ulose 2-reductase